MKSIEIKIACIIVAFASAALIAGCGFQKKEQPEVHSAAQGRGVFEWNENTLSDPASIQKLLDGLQVNRWYQELPEDLDEKKTAEFVTSMGEQNVSVYALVGSVEWGFERDGHSLIKRMESLVAYNKAVSSSERLAGIMVDVESYISSKWDENKQENMEIYVEGMLQAYQYAKKQDLLMIACIPRHYDEQGLSKKLEELIAKGCDEVAVMNYGCGNEVDAIATEAVLAGFYNKPLHCILEFQEVGKHGLTEADTYRNKGIEAAQEVFAAVEKAYPKMPVIWDYHCTAPLLQMVAE